MASFSNGRKGGRDTRPPKERDEEQIFESRCRVCTSTYRNDIDKWLVRGISQREITEHYNALGQEFSKDSLHRHSRKHLTLGHAALRQVIEKEAKRYVEDINEMAGFMLTTEAMLEVLVIKGYDQLMSGETLVEPKVILDVMRLKREIDLENQAVVKDEMMREWKAFASAVQAICTPDQYNEIFARYEKNLEDNTAILLQLNKSTDDVIEAYEAEFTELKEEEKDDDTPSPS